MTSRYDSPLRLFLVRHGETAANAEMRYLGSRDDPLTERGVQQAARLAQSFGSLPIAAVLSSPLRRALGTAEPIARKCGLAVRPDARLREGAFGDWEGLSRKEVLDRSARDADRLRSWEDDPSSAPPGGESLESVRNRILELVGELELDYAGCSLVLVTHVGPIKALFAAALGVPIPAVRRLFLDPATISVIDWGKTPLIRLFNSHGHLGWESARWMQPMNSPDH
jgi:probable phosphoglycerate mutase